MGKGWTDAKYEVVEGPRRRYVLPQWFKTFMIVLAALYGLAFAVWKASSHATAPQAAVEAAGTAGPQSPDAR